MPLLFFPHTEDASTGSFIERIDQMREAGERYKAAVLESLSKAQQAAEVRGAAPKDLHFAYNWDILSAVLRDVRELPEGTKEDRHFKADYLAKLAEIYELLRDARMSKLEAVRLALSSEATQLRGGNTASTQVAS
ncbi:MAG TPA: hypothetical protein VL360_07510 [Gammaproteobacteria bacterium]|jgi:hypothetical protein|nr:hypothetical protein [Gammaproteobacteria bacterium]